MFYEIKYICFDKCVMTYNNNIYYFYLKYNVNIGGLSIFNLVYYDDKINMLPKPLNFGYLPVDGGYLFYRLS